MGKKVGEPNGAPGGQQEDLERVHGEERKSPRGGSVGGKTTAVSAGHPRHKDENHKGTLAKTFQGGRTKEMCANNSETPVVRSKGGWGGGPRSEGLGGKTKEKRKTASHVIRTTFGKDLLGKGKKGDQESKGKSGGRNP